jgi:hypothetical protein
MNGNELNYERFTTITINWSHWFVKKCEGKWSLDYISCKKKKMFINQQKDMKMCHVGCNWSAFYHDLYDYSIF